MDGKELARSEAFQDVSFIQIGEGLYIGAKEKSEVRENKLFLNHSCNPNVGIRGQINFVSMKDIKRGQELTYDWAMEMDESYLEKDFEFECHCDSRDCRKTLTLRDWRKKELQEKYGDYFSIFILDKIRKRKQYDGASSGN